TRLAQAIRLPGLHDGGGQRQVVRLRTAEGSEPGGLDEHPGSCQLHSDPWGKRAKTGDRRELPWHGPGQAGLSPGRPAARDRRAATCRCREVPDEGGWLSRGPRISGGWWKNGRAHAGARLVELAARPASGLARSAEELDFHLPRLPLSDGDLVGTAA